MSSNMYVPASDNLLWQIDTILNWGGLVVVVTQLWAGQLRNHDAIGASGKKVFFFSEVSLPALGTNPASCSAGTGDSFPVGKVAEVRSSPLCLLPWSKINGAIWPHHCMLSWHVQGQLYLCQMCDENSIRNNQQMHLYAVNFMPGILGNK